MIPAESMIEPLRLVVDVTGTTSVMVPAGME